MATSTSYVEFVCEQLQTSHPIRYRKMFGEYVVYVNEKPILLLCDNTVFVKMLPEIASLMKDASVGFPYEGANPHYILDIENQSFTATVIDILESITPAPKSKKK